ncbi:MAG TPA: alcohol dehydrogenase [Bacteroidetes bacterium]|nr:alcohol dehydrogenase [Bacteroidota bacterium]
MQALVFDGKKVTQRQIDKPTPSTDEALIKVIYSGVCNTDLEIAEGYMNFTGVIGHEFVGVVETCADKTWLGKRVVGEINCGCNECDYCRKGLSRHCPNRTVLGILNRDGVHANYVTLPQQNLHLVPETVSDEAAAFTEPLAAALEIFAQVHPQTGAAITVIGDGKLGQLIALTLNLYSVDLTVVGKHRAKLDLLQERGIIVQKPNHLRLPPQDVVVECSGAADGLRFATALLKPQGTLVLKSTYHNNVLFNPAIWVINEIMVVGSRCGPFAPALQLLEKKMIEPEFLIAHIVDSQSAINALRLAQQKDVLKVLIDWREN